MKKRLLIPISTLLLTGFALSSCSTFKKDLDRKSKEREAEATASETTEATETSEATEATTKTTEETTAGTTKATEPSEPAAPAADAVIEFDWNDYQSAKPKAENVYTRLSEERIDEFKPSDDYGAVFPFLATTSGSPEFLLEDDYNPYPFCSYGLCDSKGRVICDPIFSEVSQMGPGILKVCIGYAPEQKIGFINASGSKFTGMKYNMFSINDDRMFCWSKDGLDILNTDLNVIDHKPFKVDLKAVYDAMGIEYIDLTDLTENDISIFEIISDDICAISTSWGYNFKMEMSTGKILGEYSVNTIDVGVKLITEYETNTYYLINDKGEKISDDYHEYIYNTKLAILGDGNGNYFGFDRKGNLVKELGNLTGMYCQMFDDYFVLVDEDHGTSTVYDLDYNEYGTYETDRSLYIVQWEPQSLSSYSYGPIPYVRDKDNIVNPLTGKTVLEGVKTDTLYVYGDLVGGVAYSDYDHPCVFSNGNSFTIREGHWEYPEFDYVLKKPYIISFSSDDIEIYDVNAGASYIFELERSGSGFGVRYRINNDTLLLAADYTTTAYDISDIKDPKVIFRYTAIDPVGE